MSYKTCSICGMPDFNHRTPLRGRNEMLSSCDLDYSCWPPDERERVEVEVKNYQLRKELTELRQKNERYRDALKQIMDDFAADDETHIRIKFVLEEK